MKNRPKMKPLLMMRIRSLSGPRLTKHKGSPKKSTSTGNAYSVGIK